MNKDETIHIAVLEGAPDEAELIAVALRNAGHAVRSYAFKGIKELVGALPQSRVDLIYCATEAADLAATCRAARGCEDHVPVIAIATGVDTKAVVAAMEAGAHDLIMRSQSDHLRLATRRALEISRCRKGMRRCRQAFEESEKRCQALLGSSRDAIAYIRDGMHIYSNKVYVEMFGLKDSDALEGMPILDLIGEDEHDRFKEFLSGYGRAGKKAVEVCCRRDDGTEFSAVMDLSPASVNGESCTQVVIRDKTVDESVLNELEALKFQDSATGLYNRQAFIGELEQAIADVKSGARPGVVFYVDIDNFAAVRGAMGIGGMDTVIAGIGKIIAAHLDNDDFGARFGDHVFTVLSRQAGIKLINEKAEEIVKSLNTVIEVGERSMHITASLGMASIHNSVSSPYEVLAFADAACSAAKARGGNAIDVYKDPAKESEIKETQDDLRRVSLLQKALKNNLFKLFFQPIIGLSGGTEEMYDVLLRLAGEKGEAQSVPAEYMLAAERTGMVMLIDRWLVSRALHMLAEKRRRGGDASLCIRLSSLAYSDETLLPWLLERMQASKMKPSSLIFEVAESDAAAHINQIAAFNRNLKKIGCRAMLGRFGVAEAPFKLFKSVPVDIIKFHPEVTGAAGTDPAAMEKLKNMVVGAHRLNKTVIAPRVENAESMAVLFQCGIDRAQGNFIQEPDAAMRYDFSGET